MGVFLCTGTVFAATGTITTGYQQSTFSDQDADDDGFDDVIDWRPPNTDNPVSITDSAITGTIWGESVGWIKLNPTGSGGVTNTTGGVLGGYAWGENAGWISFNCANSTSTCSSANGNWKVTINTSGEFSGYAWSQNYGWIKFECPGSDTAADADSYADTCVKTDWTPSSSLMQCEDGVDNDSDGMIDYPADTGCSSLSDNTELTTSGGSGSSGGSSGGSAGSGAGSGAGTGTGAGSGAGAGSGSGSSSGGRISIPSVIENRITQTINIVTTFITKTPIQKVVDAVNTPVATVLMVVGAVSGFLMSFLTVLFSNPLSFSEMFLIPIRIWGLIMTALGLRKRNRPWGVVYDSITKQPLDPAYVVLQDLNGNEVATSITDLDGRYGFLVPPGTYRMLAHKTNYEFPSKKLSGQTHDELYQDLYLNDVITLGEGDVITKNIPMDPLHFDWNEFAKKDQGLMKFFSRGDVWFARIANILFGFGFAVTAIASYVAPKLYNVITLFVYVLLLILKSTVLKPRPYGRMRHKDTKRPIRFAIVRIFSVGVDREVSHKVTDMYGKYYCLIPNGRYYLKIDKKNTDGTYTPIHTSGEIEVTKGYINKTFDI
ncbi:MAG: carboxypeptidase regulatory-like domain-containing protein [Candidatus Pacebacteria bacterium]|nr:carboxypeptidase regulatory-like domain-containing protein [Candidatus Paceibacterota bacterium]